MAARVKNYAPLKDGGGAPFPIPDDLFPLKDCYLGNPLVKRAHVKMDMRPEHLVELIKCRENPIYFAENYCRIISVDEGIVPFKLYKFQKRMIKQYFENRFSLTVTARQMGKCVQKDSTISIRNKTTGAIYDIPIGVFYEWQRFLRDEGKYKEELVGGFLRTQDQANGLPGVSKDI